MEKQYVAVAGIGAGSGRHSGRGPPACSHNVRFLYYGSFM